MREAEDSKKEEAPEKEASAKKKREPVFKRVRKRIPVGLKGRLSRVASECSAPTPKKRATSAFIFTTKARTNSETFEETTIEKKPEKKSKPEKAKEAGKPPKLFRSLTNESEGPKLGRSFDRKLIKQLTVE